MKILTLSAYSILLVMTAAFNAGCYAHVPGATLQIGSYADGHDDRWHYDHDHDDQWRQNHPWNNGNYDR
jgi:hypothetical protein